MVDLILNANISEPTDYEVRKTVKAVVVDEKGNTLTFGPYLLGGGVEEGESDEEAIAREMIEEAGIEVEILRPLGTVVGYRDALKRKYVVNGYLCRYKEKICEPTTTEEGEMNQVLKWHSPSEAIHYIESQLEAEKRAQLTQEPDRRKDIGQSLLYNKLTALAFLKEAFK